MVISDRARLLFVHVQKTGGSTIHNRLTEVLPDARQVKGVDRHGTLNQILRIEPELSTYWTFGMVRNPWARMLSWYNMVDRFRSSKEGGASRLDRKNNFMRTVGETCPDFEAFVMKGLDEFKRLQTPQWRYLATKTRRADFIGRQENFDADLQKVWERIGLEWPGESLKVNTGPTSDYRQHYTDEMRDKVAEVFAKDLKRFKYEF